MANNATKKITNITNPGSIGQATFADQAAAIRMANAGLDWTPKGAVGTTAVQTGDHNPVLVYNSTGAVVFVAFGAQTMVAPTDATNGVPILANEKFVVSSGAFRWMRASATGLYFYVADIES